MLCRFKFKKYPELLELYKKHEALLDKVTELSIKDDSSNAELKKAIKEANEFGENVLAKKIFEVFKEKKPRLYDARDNVYVEWDDHFGSDFDALGEGERIDLIGLLDGDNVYELPSKYYK